MRFLTNARNFSISSIRQSRDDPLVQVLEKKIKDHRQKVIEFRKECGKEIIGQITVNMLYGGMRGMKSLVTETSVLSAEKGISLRGLTIEECRKKLPKSKDGDEPLPEGMFWLLLTGDIPTNDQAAFVSCEWARRAILPKHVSKSIESTPKIVHPMAQLSSACALCSSESEFVKDYRSECFDKLNAWRSIYEDVMNLIGRLVPICAKIFMKTYRDKKISCKPDENKCWTTNFCEAIEMPDPDFIDLMRMYFSVHSDHEGGNVSAHTTHLVGSALSDPYLAYASGMNGLAGPLHGLANQECLNFLDQMIKNIGDKPSKEDIAKFVKDTLAQGKVIPGFGHAVLRKTDPRYSSMREFAFKHLPDDPLFKITSDMLEVIPPILKSLGKVQNPWPNVDAHSGVLLQHYGLREKNFYTVLFGMSRALGVLASLIWDRALLLPIERPKSMSTDGLIELLNKKN